jgi:metal-sulfur cluster biosynthetic enzyme
MSSLEEEVDQALRKVMDPETGLSITRMELIHKLKVTPAGDVSLVFRPSSPVCPMAYGLANTIKKVVEGIDRVRSVRVHVENFHKADHLESLLNT